MARIVVITGATSGVGEALVKRLVSENSPSEKLVLCLACRNVEKASNLKRQLNSIHPEVSIDIVQVDTSSLLSVAKAADTLKSRYPAIDCLYFNAGVMQVTGLNWGLLWPPFPQKLARLFASAEGFLIQKNSKTPEGLQEVFATNVAGHYTMLKELESHLSSQGRPCHVIWTSSSSVKGAKLDPEDIQDAKCSHPYQSSKIAMDHLSVELNHQLNQQGIFSDVACPGLVMSQMTYGLLPKWLWFVLFPLWLVIRMCVTNFFTLSAYNGSEALVWLAQQDPASLNHAIKYCSMCSALGQKYVAKETFPISDQLRKNVFLELESIRKRVLKKT